MKNLTFGLVKRLVRNFFHVLTLAATADRAAREFKSVEQKRIQAQQAIGHLEDLLDSAKEDLDDATNVSIGAAATASVANNDLAYATATLEE